MNLGLAELGVNLDHFQKVTHTLLKFVLLLQKDTETIFSAFLHIRVLVFGHRFCFGLVPRKPGADFLGILRKFYLLFFLLFFCFLFSVDSATGWSVFAGLTFKSFPLNLLSIDTIYVRLGRLNARRINIILFKNLSLHSTVLLSRIEGLLLLLSWLLTSKHLISLIHILQRNSGFVFLAGVVVFVEFVSIL